MVLNKESAYVWERFVRMTPANYGLRTEALNEDRGARNIVPNRNLAVMPRYKEDNWQGILYCHKENLHLHRMCAARR
jgi:hypothetical protein